MRFQFGPFYFGFGDESPLWTNELSLQLILINKRLENIMSSIETLASDIGDLITEAVNDITAAVAAAQAASNDPAIDALDVKVKAATQTLKDEAAKLSTPVVVAPPTT